MQPAPHHSRGSVAGAMRSTLLVNLTNIHGGKGACIVIAAMWKSS